ncbi:MAG: GatB/YqeY domain-containing protein [Coriobacteriia bacterium]|nr:GatB/YqeY domain-containing protein [Coriobacteriia bacterium]MBS5479087.1 GatB/YqeY domain-containing protein [Coriobacteriia bacterium]
MTKDEVLELIKEAMRAKDKVRLSILRQVNEEFKKIEVDQRRDVTDADVTACVKKLIKVTSETLDYSRQAGTNEERTANLARQVEILEGLLPHQVAGDELAALIDAVVSELGLSSKKDMGRLMKELGERTGGNFDKPSAAKLAGAKLA